MAGVRPLRDDDPVDLGGWRLSGRLGAGGMGTVYLGERDGRQAAVKVITASLADNAAFRGRFRREVGICRRVAGAQVAELYDADLEGPQPWLAVRYVPGPTLDEAIHSHGPLVGEALRGFILATAEALNQIHAAGVIHRDLKPSNVILTPESPVVIDFGIAAAADATAITAAGTSMGSAGWMAPEQIVGNPTTTATDVFAWGALVAFASTGSPPYGTGRPESLTYRVVHGEPSLESVPDEYRSIVASALSTDPAQRPSVPFVLRALGAGGGDVAVSDAIAATWGGDGVTKVADTRVDDPAIEVSMAQTRRRRPMAAAVIGAVIVLAAVGFGVSSTRRTGTPERGSSMVRRETEASSAVPRQTTPDRATTSTGAPKRTTTTVPPPPDVRSLHLQDVALRQQCQGTDLTIKGNGERVSSDGIEYAAELINVTYADVTGDRREDGVVEVSCSGVGGNHPSSSIAIVSFETAGIRQIGGPIDGSVALADASGFVVERPIYTDADPMCCPSGTEFVPVVIDGNGWHESGSGSALSGGDRATTTGLGSIRIGDSYAEVAAATAGPVAIHDDVETGGTCVSVEVDALPEAVTGLGGDGRLRSLEIDDPDIRTKSGLGIGSTEGEVLAAFPDKVSTEVHEYVPGGHYLSFMPDDGSGTAVFETDGAAVTRYRIGEPGWASAVEGCL